MRPPVGKIRLYGKEVMAMYGNNYPNDYDDRNAADGTAREVNAESGRFSGANTSGYGSGSEGSRAESSAGNQGNNVNAGSAGRIGTEGAVNHHYGSYGGAYQAGSQFGNQTGSGYGTGAGNQYGTGYAAGNNYQMNTANKVQKKEKKEKGGNVFWKKALAAVSLGLFFGICAGLGFFAVESVTGALSDRAGRQEAEVQQEGSVTETAKGIADSTKETAESIDKTADNLTGVTGTAGQSQAVVMDVSNVAAEVMPAIVSINNTYTQRMSYFGQTLESESTAAGSGIIVGESDTELLIVSNYHVIEDADKLVVQFVDGTETEAQMKGSDPEMDLAVIAVPLEEVDAVTRDAIAIATLGDSDSLTVGEPAIAIGNALGYGQSVTVGVISALDRVIDLSSSGEIRTDTEDGATFIQTDAAINPGNSGGALLNMRGEVIGINSNKIGGSAVEGMGYAIPISAAKPIIEDLMLRETRAKVSEDNKGYLGISPLTVVDEMAEAYGMPKGVYVSQVFEGTGAEAAGIVKGNIITEFDGNKINSSEDLLRVMEYYSVGDTVDVTIMQGSPNGWESKTVSVTLGRRME